MAQVQNPFVGPRPYAAAERDRFFGRDAERRDLAGLVVANRLTVLYGPTGAGKTSLLHAGLVPELERAGFQVMPVARPGGQLPPSVDPARLRNVYTANLLMHWHHGDLDDVAQHSLATYLRSMPQDDERRGRPLAIIIDQVEDLFATHDAYWDQREAFLQDLAECAAEARPTERPLRLVLSVRNEQLAALERFAGLLPDLLRVRLRLDPLRLPAAVEVITSVARGNFTRQEADQLAHDLAQRRVRARGRLVQVADEFVEPMQLQLACEEKWRRGRSGPLAEPAEPDVAIAAFYDAAIAHARTGWGGERKLRRFVSTSLYTPEGARTQVIRGKRSTGGLPNKLLDRLEAERILLSEERLGVRWYELAHDRLLAPVKVSNETWFESQRAKSRRWRLGLLALLIAGAAAGGALLVRWALAKYQGVGDEKKDALGQLASAQDEIKKLDKQLGKRERQLAAGAARERQLAARARLVAADADLQALAEVAAEMGRYSPRASEVEAEAERLTTFVALGGELPELRARLDALQTELDATLGPPDDLGKADKEKLAASLEKLRAEHARLVAAHAAAQTLYTTHAARLVTELDGFEAQPRAGTGNAGRAREQSRQEWREGVRALLQGQRDQARGRFERSLSRDPTNPAAHDLLARLASDPKAAESSYRKALVQAPGYGPSLGGMAKVYLGKEWFLDADYCARAALAASPFFSPPRQLLRAIEEKRAALPEDAEQEEGLSPKNPCLPPPPPAAAPAEPAPAPAAPAPAPRPPRPRRPAAPPADGAPAPAPAPAEPAPAPPAG